MNPDEATELQLPGEEVPTEAPSVPFLFGISLTIPVFAVILYIVLRAVRPRTVMARVDDGDDDGADDGADEETGEKAS